MMISMAPPAERRVGTRNPGLVLRVVRADCQKMASRPPCNRVNTSCDRFSRLRSSTRSIATPRRTQDRTATSSMRTDSLGQSSTRWQYTFEVRGQVSFALSSSGPDANGTSIRYGNVDNSSGLRVTRNLPTTARFCHDGPPMSAKPTTTNEVSRRWTLSADNV